MKLAYIPPIQFLHYAKRGEQNFVLSHMLTVDEYRDFYTSHWRYTILDNSTYELRRPVTIEETLYNAEIVKANEIIAPDVEFNFEETNRLTKDFMEAVPRHKNYTIQYVIHGITYEDMVKNFRSLDPRPTFDVLGIPLYKHNWRGRIWATWMLRQHTYRPMHLLGLWDPIEILCHPPEVRSVDCKWPFKAAIRRQEWQPNSKNLPEFETVKLNYRFENPDRFVPAIEYNLKWLEEFARLHERRTL